MTATYRGYCIASVGVQFCCHSSDEGESCLAHLDQQRVVIARNHIASCHGPIQADARPSRRSVGLNAP